MGFAVESGYTPATIDEIMLSIMNGVNTQFGTTYTAETFVGTNFYKYFYALAQRAQANEIKTSEIFLKLQQYFAITNEQISRPVVTNPGLISALSAGGYLASVKKPIDADAGKIYIAVNTSDGTHATGSVTITSYANLVSGTHDTVTIGATVFTAQSTAATLGTATFQAATDNATTAISLAAQINAHATAGALVYATTYVSGVVKLYAVHGGVAGNAIALGYTDNDTNVGATKSGTFLTGGVDSASYAATKLAINTIIKNSTVAGCVTQGTEVSTIVLSNGQSFDFKFNLPNYIPIKLRLTTVLSVNNEVVILSDDDVKALLVANIAAKYAMGLNFEPQRYFTPADAPWLSSILLEWSTDSGSSWHSTIFSANYNDLYTFDIGDITLVET